MGSFQRENLQETGREMEWRQWSRLRGGDSTQASNPQDLGVGGKGSWSDSGSFGNLTWSLSNVDGVPAPRWAGFRGAGRSKQLISLS